MISCFESYQGTSTSIPDIERKQAEGDGVFEKSQLELVTKMRNPYHGFVAVEVIVELRGGLDHWGFS